MAKGSGRNDLVYLMDIIECIQKIELYTDKLTESEFFQNTEKQDAVLRRIEIIGEAVKGVSSGIREDHPNIPWRDIAGMRDIIIHNYFGVSVGLVWRVATKDLPELKSEFEKVVQALRK
ncbi:MAG: DUF86 domain-containing protein [Bacteroidetes bacterium]|nr:MAG: DUF86 domain-containing protein [Bacteroidota bacterium]